MKKLISFRAASIMLIIIFSVLILFHTVLIIGGGILELIPTNFVWGGKLEGKGQFIIFETISLLVSGIFLFLVLIRSGMVLPRFYRVSGYVMWVFFFYFALNTVGNALAEQLLEKCFIALSLPASLLSLRLALGKER